MFFLTELIYLRKLKKLYEELESIETQLSRAKMRYNTHKMDFIHQCIDKTERDHVEDFSWFTWDSVSNGTASIKAEMIVEHGKISNLQNAQSRIKIDIIDCKYKLDLPR